ncbi:sulfite exporter TauE/SafE family protein [Flavobacterium agrisoli]|uniref:Sulfite exporter TauE/SafE family protein n=1 Tax=Flavobacterium agrisoli TaxID=2793066 RepID=A0A934PJD8_9FLAO|nr:sulfite exporter TauE/SafE family protein [Flavobacterium agrisoli]MBK0368469.1 sulfite exporter TauE/SafE family protein [Flavobacterium agrisoli]
MIFTAFIFGLLSSFHCIGMCGPIAVMLPLDHHNAKKKAIQLITYHLGRLTTYTFMGIVFGLFGRGLLVAGLQQNLSIIIGILMIVVILIPEKKLAGYNLSRPVFSFVGKIKSKLGKQFQNKSYSSIFTIGILNGMLPCGMVYVGLFGALAMQSVSWGAVYMLAFGLGTLPLMSAVVYLKEFISVSFRNKIQKIIPYVGVCIGILFILRGLGLGIPYISPSSVSLFVQEIPHCR